MIVLTGASASGKTETAKALGIYYNIRKVITHTTRQMRVGEKNDVDYHFVTKEEFLELKSKDYFVETTEYNNNFYGTSKKEIALDKVLVVETSGARVFLGLNDPHIIVYRLIAPMEMRAKRMAMRGDDPEIIKQRLTNDVTRFADSQFIDPRITDIDTSNHSIEEVAKIIHTDYMRRVEEIDMVD